MSYLNSTGSEGVPVVEAPREPVSDDVWEALQRLIENAASLGPSSMEDAMVVARWRGQFVAARESATLPPATHELKAETDRVALRETMGSDGVAVGAEVPRKQLVSALCAAEDLIRWGGRYITVEDAKPVCELIKAALANGVIASVDAQPKGGA